MAYKVVKKNVLNPQIFLMEVEAPLVAKKAEPGQFIILRIDEYGERVPFTRQQRTLHRLKKEKKFLTLPDLWEHLHRLRV